MQAKLELPDSLLLELQRRAPEPSGQAELLARILTDWFSAHPRTGTDLDLINENVAELNAEARDVLDYQSMQ